jgi:hypothetical protein
MAGPYDVEALGGYELNATKIMQYPAFLAYIADSYFKAYSDVDIDDIAVNADVFKSVDLFGGHYNAVEIHAYLGLANPANGDYGFKTHRASELFKTTFIDDYHSNNGNALREHFRQNSVYDWTPQTKVRLIHCQDDEIIPYLLSTKRAYDAMSANGADVSEIVIPTSILSQQVDASHPFVHANCAPKAYGVAVKWFNDIRNGVIK